MAMNPFRLTIELNTPMQVGKYSPRLDGLLWHTLFSHLGCPVRAVHSLSDFLQITGSSGNEYFKASGMYFATVKPQPGQKVIDSLVGHKTAKPGVMRPGIDLSPNNFKPTGKRGNSYTKVQVLGGPYKNRLDSKLTYYASHVVFDGVGKGEEIADLIRFYIPAIGVNANNGAGTIGDIYHSQLPVDTSLVDASGLPARPIPIEDFSALSDAPISRTGEAILVPPFRDQKSVNCVLPERIRKTVISKPGV